MDEQWTHTFNRYRDAKINYDDVAKVLNNLTEKRQSTGADLPKLENIQDSREQAKTEAFENFCTGNATQDDVDKAQADYETAVITLKRATELHNAVANKERVTAETLPKLERKYRDTERACWTLLSKKIIGEIRGDISENLNKAYAAVKRSTNHQINFSGLMKMIGEVEPSQGDLDTHFPSLDQEFKKIEKQLYLAS